MYENMVEICYHNDFDDWFQLWDIFEFYVLHGRDVRKITDDLRVVSKEYAKMICMDNATKKIIEDAINNPEFIERLAKAFDLLPCIKEILECDDVIALESLKSILEDRINQLNIQYWFERLN